MALLADRLLRCAETAFSSACTLAFCDDELRLILVVFLLRNDALRDQRLPSVRRDASQIAVGLALLQSGLRLLDGCLSLFDGSFGLADLLIELRRIDFRQRLTRHARDRRCPQSGSSDSRRRAPESELR